MKKKLIRITAGLILSATLILPSCEGLENCGFCELVTNNDGEISTRPPIFFCGENLTDKQSSSPVTIGNITTYWDCD